MLTEHNIASYISIIWPIKKLLLRLEDGTNTYHKNTSKLLIIHNYFKIKSNCI